MFFANMTHKRGSIDSFHPTWLSISILMRPRKKPFKIMGLFFSLPSLSLFLFLPCRDKPRALISPHPGPGFSFRGFTRDNSRVPRDWCAPEDASPSLFTTSLSLFPLYGAKPWRDPFCQLFPGSLFVPRPAKSLSGVWSWLFHGREPRINSTFRDGTLRTSMGLEFFSTDSSTLQGFAAVEHSTSFVCAEIPWNRLQRSSNTCFFGVKFQLLSFG